MDITGILVVYLCQQSARIRIILAGLGNAGMPECWSTKILLADYNAIFILNIIP